MKPRALILVALLALAGCDRTPTGRSQLALVPDAMMTDMGRDTFARMKQEQSVATDSRARSMVQCVASAIVDAVSQHYPDAETPESWEVVLFDNPTPNAFALPGGKIGVHTGLLKVAENPSQLAAVVGHEVGHLLADHGNERLTQQMGIKAALLLIGLFGDVEHQELLQALGLGAQLGITLPFSRAHEREADLMGLNLMATAGFQPRQSVELWRNMARQGSEQPLEFLSTHPAHDTRIEQLQAHMDTALRQYRQQPAAPCPA